MRSIIRNTSSLGAWSGAAQRRALHIHEAHAKQLLSSYGAKTEFGVLCNSIKEVADACNKVKTEKKVVKAQILAGGRGKGTFTTGFKGGVHVCKNAEEAVNAAKQMLGKWLVTKQTTPAGVQVNKLFVTEAIPHIKRELYCALLLDRKSCSPMFIGSAEGGMNIEQLAAEHPELIKKLTVNVHKGFDDKAGADYARELGFTGASVEKAVNQLRAIYNLAREKDATMVEINPLVELENGDVMCIDAKLGFDDNAKFRQPEIWALEDNSEQDHKEREAEKLELNYVALDGSVGCLVNGAGLAMATMDIVSLYGARPANFLDVGGGAKRDQVVGALKIITADPSVKCVLINIFGGIMKCDVIAQGIIEAAHILGKSLHVPLVVRLEGTNQEEGRKLLAESGLKVHSANDLDEAARLAAKIATDALAKK